MTSLIIVLILFVGLLVFSQVSSDKEQKRNREYEIEREKKKREVENNISKIIQAAQTALDLKRYDACLKEIEKLEKFDATSKAFELKIQSLAGLRKFQAIADINPPYSDFILKYKVIALFELNKIEEAVYCINLGLKGRSPETFVQLFHSYLNPYENFKLFWSYLDKETKSILSSRMDYGKVSSRGPILRSYKIEDATILDFVKLIQKDNLDLSRIDGDGSYRSPKRETGPYLTNLGFLKYFENLKILNLRGQKQLVSSWGINFNNYLNIVNLSDIPDDVSSIITGNISNIDNVKIFKNDSDFISAKIELSPFWVKYRSLEKYHAYIQDKLTPQDYPQIFIPQCYFSDSLNFKSNLNVTLPKPVPKNSTTVGKSEAFFKQYLVAAFGDKILTEQALSLHESYNPIYPDFVYQNENVLIDIEIDEPYVYSTQMPTHYHEYDRDRNYHFMQRDWFIVRFSEEQVIKHPEKCISFLIKFIELIDIGKAIDLVENKYIREFDFSHSSWAIEDCIKMANNSYRNKYLPK
jgi:hypothetical protein